MNWPTPTERQARIIWLALTGLSVAVLIGLLAGLVWGLGRVLQQLSPVLWPIAVAGVLSYLLDPLVDRFERGRMSRQRAVLCVFGLALVVIIALFGSVVPQVISESRQLVAGVPAASKKLQAQVERWINNPPQLMRKFLKTPPAPTAPSAAPRASGTHAEPAADVSQGLAGPTASATNATPMLSDETLQTATGWLAAKMPLVGSWLFGQVGKVASWLGVLAGLALVPVYTFYFLLEKRGISARWSDYLPLSDSKFKTELVFVLSSINGYLIAFFRGQLLVAICDGVLYTAGFLALGLNYAVLIGAAAVFLTMIPFLGAIVTCLTAVLIALVQFGDWFHPVAVLGVVGLVQVLEGLFISPRIMGDRVGLHPVTIIIAVMAGTTLLGGLLGGILAIPLTAALRVLMGRYIWKRPVTDEPGAA